MPTIGTTNDELLAWLPLHRAGDGGECVHDASFIKVIEVHTAIGVRARGAGRAAAPQTRAKPLFFGQKVNFSGRSQQPKMKKVFLYLLNEKTEFILSSEIKCPKPGIFTNNYWVG